MKQSISFKLNGKPVTLSVNGGESGWYYLARAAKWVYLVIEQGMDVPNTNAEGLGGSRPFE